MTPAQVMATLNGGMPGLLRCTAERNTVTAEVASRDWAAALAYARDVLGCAFYDWLTAVDEGEQGFAIVAHLCSLDGGHHLLARTRVPRDAPVLASVAGVYRGAAWAERETSEMFGVVFEGHPEPGPLLLPGEFEGHPLRKEFPLAARAALEWPGGKEPGERAPSQRSRRRLTPPGVPEGWRT